MKKAFLWLLAFLLTGTLIVFSVSFVARQMLVPAMADDGAPVGDDVIREEQELVRERITELSELYGFSAEPVIALVDGETLRDLNEQAALWWKSVLRDGMPGTELKWNIRKLEQLLEEEALSGEDAEEAEYFASTVAEEIRKSVIRMALPMRQPVIRIGMQVVEKRVDLPNIITFFLGVPWTMLAVSFLLAGIIAFTDGRIRRSFRYIGSALGAAALVLAALAALYLCAGILPMIREASASLTFQYQKVVTGALVLTGVIAVVMAAGCAAGLKLSRESGKTA